MTTDQAALQALTQPCANDDVVGRTFKAWDGRRYRCDAHDHLGYWMCYTQGTYEYSANVTLPFEYPSAEAAIVDLEALLKRALAAREEVRQARAARGAGLSIRTSPVPDWRVGERVTFAGHNLEVDDFLGLDRAPSPLYLPMIYTLEEWFAALAPR